MSKLLIMQAYGMLLWLFSDIIRSSYTAFWYQNVDLHKYILLILWSIIQFGGQNLMYYVFLYVFYILEFNFYPFF